MAPKTMSAGACILLLCGLSRASSAAATTFPKNTVVGFAALAAGARIRRHRSTRSYERQIVVATWMRNRIEDAPSSSSSVARIDVDAGDESTNSVPNDPPRNYRAEIPPHTALAQVLANQYGIDLASVSPSKDSKITAEDVEYHAWMIAQPPCTPEALRMAYSMGLDLNGLYDDDDGEYVMGTADVRLYVENSRSLRMSTQTTVKRGAIPDSDGKRTKKMRALDRRMEQNVAIILDKTQKLARSLTGGIIQQAQLQMLNVQRSSIDNESVIGGGTVKSMMGKNTDNDIHSIGDFDVDLANAIQEALSTAGKSLSPRAGNGLHDKGAENLTNMMTGKNDVAGIVHSIDDFDVKLANEIRLALLMTGESSPPTAEGERSVDNEGVESSSSVVAVDHSIESELQSMTCAQLRERLRLRGMKVSGKKADLVNRLLLAGEDDGAIARNHDGNDEEGEFDDVPFFGTLR